MVGTGVLAASRTTSRSTLVNVKKLTPVRWMNLIKVSQLLQKNRVYVPDEDFDFVYDFLCHNSPNAAYRPIPRPPVLINHPAVSAVIVIEGCGEGET